MPRTAKASPQQPSPPPTDALDALVRGLTTAIAAHIAEHLRVVPPPSAKPPIADLDLLTIEEAAALARCSERTIHRRLADGRLPRAGVTRLVRIPRSAVEKLARLA